MRIGILTYHNTQNYGALLQCYALQEYLKKNGYTPQIIDIVDKKRGPIYRTLDKIKNETILFLKSPLNYLKEIKLPTQDSIIACFMKIKYQKKHNSAFSKFVSEKLSLTPKYHFKNLKHNFNEFDAIIVGSDQIWNTSSLKKHKSPYFFSKFDSYKGLRISYAACRGINARPSKDIDLFKKALDSFHFISVRDLQTKQFVSNVANKESIIVCDPTMLHDYSEFDDNNFFLNEYIATYILGKEINGGHRKIIEKLRETYPNAKIISIVLTTKHPKYYSWSDKIFYDCTPQQWISLFKNAKFIYTDSFHGVIFASKFKKPFLCYYTEKKRASRLIDLAQRYFLNEFIVSNFEEALEKKVFSKKPDYTLFEKSINEQLQISYNFIKSSCRTKTVSLPKKTDMLQ